MTNNNSFKVGIYLRLSNEDIKYNEKESQYIDESRSISNQRDLIMNYIIKNKLMLIEEYIDDGISGTQFDREGWNRLIKDIENGRINMVITKDMSRLGRNISQSLYYSTEYFQEKNIRYVALTDGVDTFDKLQNTDMLLFKAFYNEMYVKDISTKIKATLNSQKRNGKFMGGIAPFGYDRNIPYDKHELIINEEQAKIVKRIFTLSLSGMGIKKIANLLTEEKIPIPSVYKNLNRGIKSNVYGIWQEATVRNILTNPTYKGDLTQCREYKVSYKSKKRKKNNKKNWIIAKGACPAIIDEETFNMVQNMYSKNRNRNKKSDEFLLRGFLFCKECGHTISINKVKQIHNSKNICYCNYYKKYSRYKVCTPHKLNYDELEIEILKDIKIKCSHYLKIDKLHKILESNNKIKTTKIDLERQLVRVRNDLAQQDLYINTLYKDRLKELIDETMFKKQYDNIAQEKEKIRNNIYDLEKRLFIINNKLVNNKSINYNHIIKEYLSFNNSSKKLISSLIEKIVIDEEKNINIYYKIKPVY